MITITFLGTNGWFDTRLANTICTLIETPQAYLVLDAGNGFYKLDRYIHDDAKPIYLFLSHFHVDHIEGLHTLAKCNFPQGIQLFGPAGTKKILAQFLNHPFTAPLDSIRTRVTVTDLEANMRLPVAVEFRELKHTTVCYGYRFSLDNKTVAYCTDTGICDNFLYLARQADVLMSECSFKTGQQDVSWGHLNPEVAAGLARDAGVKKLVLLHFDASLYPTWAHREEAQRVARSIFKHTMVARDDKRLNIKGKGRA